MWFAAPMRGFDATSGTDGRTCPPFRSAGYRPTAHWIGATGSGKSELRGGRTRGRGLSRSTFSLAEDTEFEQALAAGPLEPRYGKTPTEPAGQDRQRVGCPQRTQLSTDSVRWPGIGPALSVACRSVETGGRRPSYLRVERSTFVTNGTSNSPVDVSSRPAR
jgi:hypothetical protein